MNRLPKAQSLTMNEGAEVQARRERLGMDKKQLAIEAGVSRQTLAEIEAGKGFRASSLTKIVRALERAEAEAGITGTPAQGVESSDFIEFDVSGDFGVHVIVKGPIRDADLLRRQVAELVRDIRNTKGEDRDPATDAT